MVRYMTMTEMALEGLRKSILQGELKPGTQLVPAKLETELSLSREAIRDAIRQIVGYGLAETITNKGTYVAQPLTLAELEVIFELRLKAEPKIAAAALKNLTNDQVKELAHLSTQMESLSDASADFADHFVLNREFHLNLYKPVGWNHLHRAPGLGGTGTPLTTAYPLRQTETPVGAADWLLGKTAVRTMGDSGNRHRVEYPGHWLPDPRTCSQ